MRPLMSLRILLLNKSMTSYVIKKKKRKKRPIKKKRHISLSRDPTTQKNPLPSQPKAAAGFRRQPPPQFIVLLTNRTFVFVQNYFTTPQLRTHATH